MQSIVLSHTDGQMGFGITSTIARHCKFCCDFYTRYRLVRYYVGVFIRALNFDYSITYKRARYIPRLFREYKLYKNAQNKPGVQALPIKLNYPILYDYDESAGVAKGDYFHQDIWAARKVYHANPTRHVDIGSRVDGFVAHVMVFRTIEVIDIRPMKSELENLTFLQADATNMNGFDDNSLESISSLHAAEHFGLGRYGDPIDPNGHLKFMSSLARVLKPGGRLYFSVPIGQERVEFNAHRVISPLTVLKQFSDLKLVSFSAVNDTGDFIPTAKPEDFVDANYSCGLYEFTKVGRGE